jgi:hypothetical protein
MDDPSAQEWRWYIIRQENALPQFWSFIINLLTIYALFLTPLDLVFPQLGEILQNFELFVDACFTFDIILNFFKLEGNQKLRDLSSLRC